MTHSATLRMALASSALLLASACQSHAVVLEQDRAALISACKMEAVSGHNQGPLSQRNEHRRKMSAICEEWRSVNSSNRDALAKRCLAEAGKGPSIGSRKHSTNQSHNYRLKALCRRLAAM